MTDFLPEAQPETDQETPTAAQNWVQFFREILETIGLAVLLFLVINIISARVRVDGVSMVPTLKDNDFVLINRLVTYHIGEFHRGDIVVFRPPMYPNQSFWQRFLWLPDYHDVYEDYIKRIIGLPGDQVRVVQGVVYVNGVELKEPYIAAPPAYTGEWTVPEGSLFVLGDNRNNSSDSHAWGFVPEKNVLGSAVLVYWPFPDWKLFRPNQAVLAAP